MMSRVFLLTTLLTTLVADAATGGMRCNPEDRYSAEDEETAEGQTGKLFDNNVDLYWRMYDSWDEGTCIELWFQNVGDPMVGYWFDVTWDTDITTIHHMDAAALDVWSDGESTVSPDASEELANGDSFIAVYCIEPIAEPIAFTANRGETLTDTTSTAATTGVAGTSGTTGVAGTPTTGTGATLGTPTTVVTEPEFTGPGLFGTVADDTHSFLLTWEQTSESEDEACFDLTVGNLTPNEFTDWELIVHLDERVQLTQVSDAFRGRLDRPDELTVSPSAGTATFPAYANATGNMCWTPIASPIQLEATWVDLGRDEDVVTPPVVDDPSDGQGSTGTGGPFTDTMPPGISNVRHELSDSGATLDIVFETSETATGQVCDSSLFCKYTTTSGLTHVVSFPYSGDTYTIIATDRSGNTRELGPFQF